MHPLHAAPPDIHDPQAAARLGRARLAIGLCQGVLLYLLDAARKDGVWPATHALLFTSLVVLACLVPVLVLDGLGRMPRRRLLAWAAMAGTVVALLGAYDAWRALGVVAERSPMPSSPLALCLVAGCFIGHALVLAGAQDRRPIASYATYFETAWKLHLQLAASLLFVGATWLALHLGAALFALVKLDFLMRAMTEPWFAIPVSTVAFAGALHLTDVKPQIVRGIRHLLHLLLSMLLPVVTVLVGGFLTTLPFTGLEPLWATRSAASLLLSAAAAFIVLINAAWQDGRAPAARPIAACARIAGLLLVPLTLLAGQALALRVGDHGWSADRIVASACLLVAACYAGGYAAAALRRGWLPTLAGVNVAAAFVVLVVLVLLSSPVLDPARISVNSQLARLDSGRITLRQLDVAYLYHHGARYGREAIATLEGRTQGADAAWLREELARLRAPDSFDAGQRAAQVAANLRAWPLGARLPDGFADYDWSKVKDQFSLPPCLRQQNSPCDAFLLDLDGDARPEVILLAENGQGNAVLRQDGAGAWAIAGSLSLLAHCQPVVEAMRAGRLRAVAPALSDLEVAGQRVTVLPEVPTPDCMRKDAPAARPVEDAPR